MPVVVPAVRNAVLAANRAHVRHRRRGRARARGRPGERLRGVLLERAEPDGVRHERHVQLGAHRGGERVPGDGARVHEVHEVRRARGPAEVDQRGGREVERDPVDELVVVAR